MATKLDLADAQFIGYHIGRREGDIIALVSSMGLTKREWIKWQKDYVTTYLTEREIEEINAHFGIIIL